MFTKGERFILGWQYQFAGNFDKALAEAMSKADNENLKKFAWGFPEETGAMLLYKTEKDWWQNLQSRYLEGRVK